jgi:guanylate kinase
VQDIDYHFITDQQFQEYERDGKFAECEPNIHGHAYGTLKCDIEEAQRTHQFVFHVIDVKGAKTLLACYPNARAIFITATASELRGRLAKRGDTPEAIERRMARVALENALAKTAPFTILWNQNRKFKQTCSMFHAWLLITSKAPSIT